MANITIASPGLDANNEAAGRLKIFLVQFAGEVLTAYNRTSVTLGRHLERTITAGKAASFPIFGRATSAYLKAGASLDDLRTNIKHSEVDLKIDGLLTSDCLIFDLDEAMAHFDLSTEYSKQIGEALAFARDGGLLAEIAKLVVADKENLPGLGKGAIITEALAAADIGETEAMGKAIAKMLLKAKTKMSDNYVPAGDRVCYMRPVACNSLIAFRDTINKEFGAIATITDANILRVCGFDIIECPHLTIGGATVTDGVIQGTGHIFPEAYKDTAMFLIAHRTSVGTLTLKGLAIEHARRPEFQADQIIGKYAMGHGGLRPEAVFMGVVTSK